MKRVWQLLKCAVTDWMDDSAPRLGAALSYYTLFAISPLFIIIIFLASFWLDRASVQHHLFEQIAGLLGAQGAQALQSAFNAATPKDQGFIASIVAALTLVLTSIGLFLELQAALNRIWGVVEKSGQGIMGFVKNRLLSLAMVLGIGFLLLVSLVLSAALSALSKYVGDLVPGLGAVWMTLNALLSFGIITVLFAFMFKFLPDAVTRWKDVWVGAATTALLFTLGKFLLGWYLGRNATVSAYGAAGSVVLLLLWVYYSAQILFFGAELTQAYASLYGTRVVPKSNARWIEAEIKTSSKIERNRPPSAPDRKALLVEELRQQVDGFKERVGKQSHSPRLA